MRLLLSLVLLYFCYSCSNTVIPKTAIPQKYPEMDSEFAKIIKSGKIHRVFRRLQAKPELIHSKNKKKQTLLHLAAARNHYDLVESLINAGAEVNVEDSSGDTPLHLACFSGYVESVELLIGAGAKPNHKNRSGETAVHKAAFFCHQDIFDLLHLKSDMQGANNHGSEPIHIAARRQNTIFVKALVKINTPLTKLDKQGDDPLMSCLKGLNSDPELEIFLVHESKNIHFKNAKGESYLHAAATNGKTKAIEALLTRGANVNAKDSNGITPIIRAFRYRKYQAAELLVSGGADLKTIDKEGRTVLHLMAFSIDEHTALQKYIKEININAVDNKGRTALHEMAYWGYLNNVRELVNAGAKINVRAKNGEHCLFEAVKANKVAIVKLLVEHKVNLTYLNKFKESVLAKCIARTSQNVTIIRILLKAGINPNTKNIYEETPLHEAVRQENSSLVKLLLEYEVDAKIEDRFGKTARAWALERNLPEIAELLKEGSRKKR